MNELFLGNISFFILILLCISFTKIKQNITNLIRTIRIQKQNKKEHNYQKVFEI